MRKLLLMTTVAAGLAMGVAGAATAAPIVDDFTSVGSVVNLGSSETYMAGAGTPMITAYSGSYSGTTVTRKGVLVGNNRALDEQGLGVCLGSVGENPVCDDTLATHPEIDVNSKELVQLDIGALLTAGYTSLKVNADSATSGELLLTYGSGSQNSLGTLLASISSASGDVSVTQNGNFLNFISSGPNGSDVLLHSLSADKVATPEPVSIAVLGVGLLGLGMTRRLRSKS